MHEIRPEASSCSDVMDLTPHAKSSLSLSLFPSRLSLLHCAHVYPINDNTISASPCNRWTTASLTLIHPTSIREELIGMLERWLPATVLHMKALHHLINESRQSKIRQRGSAASGDRADVSPAHFSHVTCMRSWPWGGVRVRCTQCLPILCCFHTVTCFGNDYSLLYPHFSAGVPPSRFLFSLSLNSFIIACLWKMSVPLPVVVVVFCCLAGRGLEGRLFGWDGAPCFCQACSLTQRFSRHVSFWNGYARCQMKRRDKLSKATTLHALKWRQMVYWWCVSHVDMHMNTLEVWGQAVTDKKKPERCPGMRTISYYSSRSGTASFEEMTNNSKIQN